MVSKQISRGWLRECGHAQCTYFGVDVRVSGGLRELVQGMPIKYIVKPPQVPSILFCILSQLLSSSLM